MGKKLTTEEFIERCKLIHGDRYDYSLINYVNLNTKLEIVCKLHGKFEQLAVHHIKGGGCSKCSKNRKLTTEEFVERCKKIYGDKYDYSKTKYINLNTKVEIICKTHGSFNQTPEHHMNGHSCSFCNNVGRKTTEQYIEKAKKTHNNFYDYSLTEFVNNKIKVKIICPKHGEFLQDPKHHLNKVGCPNCKSSHAEIQIKNFLVEQCVIFEEQKKFSECRNKNPLPFDFYLPVFNICIEYDGEQHFINNWFGGVDELNKTKFRDNIKTTFCEKNSIFLLRISYKENIEEKLQWLMNYLKIKTKD